MNQQIKNLCNDCPNQIRGLCCYVNIPIGDFNIILENVACPQLNKETKLCSDYENRKQFAPWCLHGENMFGKGGLPKGCLYLIDHPEREPNPKVKIREILDSLPFNKQQELVGKYNIFNNIPFKKYVELGLETN